MPTIPPNNTSGLYGIDNGAVTINNDIVANAISANTIVATGNITGGNLLTPGQVSAAGNVTGNYFIGDGSLLTNINAGNIVGSYGNANVAQFLANYGSNTLSTTGNVTVGNILTDNYLYANGQPISFAGTYSNANVAAYLPTYTGNIAAGNGNITNDLVVGGTIYGTFSGNISGNLVVPGANTEIIYNNAGNAGASSDFRFDSATRVMLLNGTANVANIIVPQTGTIDVGNSRIQNVAEPLNGSDAATKDYVDGGFSSDLFSITADGNTFGVAKLDNITFQGVANQTTVTIPASDTLEIGLANAISVSGNITGSYILGNGSQLTGLPATYGNSNVATFLANYGSNVISTTGNVTAGYFIGNGSLLTGLSGTYSNANVAAFLAAFGSNTISTSGNITSGNVLTGGAVSATGNVTGNYFIGNGSQLTGITTTYGNANVANYLPTYSGNVGSFSTPITLTGSNANITGGTVRMTGNSVTISAGVTTLDLQAQQTIRLRSPLGTTANVLIESLNTSVTGNIIHTAGTVSTTGNVTAANVLTGGAVSATGNVTGLYIIGDGSLLTNLPGGSYGNANVANYLPTFTGNVGAGNLVMTSTSGVAYVNNVTGLAGQPVIITADGTEDIHLDADSIRIGDNNTDATIVTHGTGDLILRTNEGSATEGNIIIRDGASGNIDIQTNGSGVVNITGAAGLRVTDGISAVGNITGANIIGNGQFLTNLPGANVTGTVANATYALTANSATFAGTVTTNAQPNITSVGILTSLSSTGNITGANIIGNGQFLTNLPGANVTGTVANATYALSANNATFAGTVTTNAQPNITSVGILTSVTSTGNVTGGNILTGGLISATGNITANYYFGNGSQLTGIVSAPAGSNTQVQFNDNGVLAGDINLTFNKNTGLLTTDDFSSQTVSTSNITATNGLINANLDVRGNVYNGGGTGVKVDDDLIVYGTLATTGNVNPTTGISCTGNVSGNYFIGDGSQLTNISGGNIVGGYGNANVVANLAALSSNPVSTTGNITGGNLVTTGVISATGNITGNYFLGNGSQLTGITTAAGGSNTQLQFNDSGSFAGNANVTFNKATGNMAIGNIIFATGTSNTTTGVFQNWYRPANSFVGNTTTVSRMQSARILLGDGFGNTVGGGGQGDFGTSMEQLTSFQDTNVLVAQRFTKTDNGIQSSGLVVQHMIDISGNIGAANINSRMNAAQFLVGVGGNTGSGNLVAFNPLMVRAQQSALLVGNQPNTSQNVGDINVTAGCAVNPVVAIAGNSRVTTAVGTYVAFTNQSGNANAFNHTIGYGVQNSGNAATLNFSLLHMQLGNSTQFGINQLPTQTYRFLNNQDWRSSSVVGPVESSLDRVYTIGTTTGNVTIEWPNGTTQYLKPTGNVTLAYANATVSSNGNLLHTVNLIVEQGTTAYTVTLPTGNANILYASGNSTVPSTANAVTFINVAAGNINGVTKYMTSIGPEYT